MNAIGNNNLHPGLNAAAPKGLSDDDVRLLKTIYSGAAESSDITKAGRGYMGLAKMGGRTVPVKFMTHWWERGLKTDSSLMEGVWALRGGSNSDRENCTGAFNSSDYLETVLRNLADKAGAGNTVDELLTEYKRSANNSEGKSLLSREIVFRSISAIRAAASTGLNLKIDFSNVDTRSSKGIGTKVAELDKRGFDSFTPSFYELCGHVDPSRMFTGDDVRTNNYLQLLNGRLLVINDCKNKQNGGTEISFEQFKGYVSEAIEEVRTSHDEDRAEETFRNAILKKTKERIKPAHESALGMVVDSVCNDLQAFIHHRIVATSLLRS